MASKLMRHGDGPPLNFSGLATEIKSNIFDFLRKGTDMGHARLVCREWKMIITPRMYQKMSLDLRNLSVGRRERLSIVLRRADGVAQYVRELCLLRSQGGYMEDCGPYEGNDDRDLLSLFPPDSLKAFRCSESLEVATFVSVLQRQKDLEELEFWPHFWDGDTPSTWFERYYKLCSSSASQLRSLRLVIDWDDRHEMFCKTFSLILFHATKLKQLSIVEGPNSAQGADSSGWLPKLLAIPGEGLLSLDLLTDLRLERLDIGSVFIDALARVTLPNLHIFRIMECYPIVPLLVHLTKVFSEKEPQLKELSIVVSADSERLHVGEVIDKLLLSFTGLQRLFLDSCDDLYFVSENAIVHHSKSLRELVLGARDCDFDSPHLSVAFLSRIIRRCSGLEQLGVNLLDPHLNDPDEEEYESEVSGQLSLESHSAGSQIDFSDMLNAIASAPALHTLRILSFTHEVHVDNRAIYGTDGHRKSKERRRAERAAWTAQDFATKAFAYLIGHGSTARIVALSPLPGCDHHKYESDDNGHRWPHYYYVPRRITSALHGSWVEAEPLSNLCEMPESTILKWPQ